MRLEFFYNLRGFGDLRLMNGGSVVDSYKARTGSITKKGELKNAIPPGDWLCIEKSVDTDEIGMAINPGNGWKLRLYRVTGGGIIWTHYLVHPDGGLPGSKGCIVIQGTDAVSFRHELDNAIRDYDRLPVIIKQEL